MARRLIEVKRITFFQEITKEDISAFDTKFFVEAKKNSHELKKACSIKTEKI